MKKTLLSVAALMACCNPSVAAQQLSQPADTAMSVQLDGIDVVATRADANTPIAFTNITARDLRPVNTGLDIPFLLSSTPGVLTTSDAGAGVGYSSLRVRGTDATRINITVNDIPMNDAESHSIYWVNTPDLASSLGSVQLQRGVGTSVNGSGAFGASVNMATGAPSSDAYGELSGSYGSFDTHKATLKLGTGLLADHWTLDARLSHIGSDGYRDRASSRLQSYYAQLAYQNQVGTMVRFVTFGGKEATYHAWDGISRDELKLARKYNPNGEIKHDGKVTGFYDDQKDFYRQTHYQLLLDQELGKLWHLNVGLHYTDGHGYYQEYKNNRTLKEYLLEPIQAVTGTVKKSSLVRKKAVVSDFGGMVFSLRHRGERLNATLGGGINRYVNHHYGRVLWVENYTATLAPAHEYYRNTGRKTDVNIYAKGSYTIVGGLSAYADLQYRHLNYKITGDNDKWDWTASPEHLQTLAIDETFDFFNPKVGLNLDLNKLGRVYASVAVAHKEPTRNNYTDGLFLERPRAERLLDYELGYQYSGSKFTAGINLYYMHYRNQLILNGKLNEIGEMMAENVPSSYRMGVELMAGWRVAPWFHWEANATLSRNRIKNYVAYLSDYNADTWDEMYTQTAIDCGNTTIAFSPSVIANNVFAFNYKGLEAILQSQWVSRQFLDNMRSREDSLDPYFVSNLHLNYTFKCIPALKAVTVGVSVYNLFNERYENNGYTMTAAMYPAGNKANALTLSHDPRFYPMAGTNVLGHLTIAF